MMQNWPLIGKKNMANKILIDTNILLDYLLTREPFYEDARFDVEGIDKNKLLAGLKNNDFLDFEDCL